MEKKLNAKLCQASAVIGTLRAWLIVAVGEAEANRIYAMAEREGQRVFALEMAQKSL